MFEMAVCMDVAISCMCDVPEIMIIVFLLNLQKSPGVAFSWNSHSSIVMKLICGDTNSLST